MPGCHFQSLWSFEIVDPELYGVTEVVQSRCETLTAIIRISALSENQRKIISELSLGKFFALMT